MTEQEAFFLLHSDLPREGPGTAEDVDWAMSLIGPAHGGTILDAGCGPGADIPALLRHVPEGRVVALDAHAPFIDRINANFADDPRVIGRVGSMADPGGPYAAIWCAGALYFLGVEEGLEIMKPALEWGGAIAFSEPCWFTNAPGQAAEAFWGDYDGVTSRKGLFDKLWKAGLDPIGDRKVSDEGWEAYYGPMEQRINSLRDGAGPELTKVLDAHEKEIALWHEAREDTGYLLVVAVPR